MTWLVRAWSEARGCPLGQLPQFRVAALAFTVMCSTAACSSVTVHIPHNNDIYHICMPSTTLYTCAENDVLAGVSVDDLLIW